MNPELLNGLIGGMIIGLSMVLMMALLGRIAGISGIIKSALFSNNDRLWRILFIVGIIIGTAIVGYLKPETFVLREGFSKVMLIVSGLFVGIGTSLANGCTSGHGLCGMARFSKRSIIATLTFMATAILVVYLQSKLVGA